MPKKIIYLTSFFFLFSCASLPDNSTRVVSSAFTPAPNIFVDELFPKDKTDHIQISGFRLLDDGLDAFVARAVLIKQAKQSIDAQYYLVHDDLVGNSFLGLLLEAAERGVRVRLLIDDIDLKDMDTKLAALDAHPNFEIRSFNPFSRRAFRATQYLTRFGSVTRRMHNKTFTMDNQLSILGGRNIGDEYFSASANIAFGDLDVLTIGPVVQDVTASFDEYWNNKLSFSLSTIVKKNPSPQQAQEIQAQVLDFLTDNTNSAYAIALRESPFVKAIGNGNLEMYWGNATLVSDSADKLSSTRDKTNLFLEQYLETEFAQAKNNVTIISPYFIPGKNGLEAFSALEQQGVNVRVLTNSLASNNHPVVHAHYAKYRKSLMRAGVELYEARAELPNAEKSGVLHTKAFLIDRKRVFIGSLNFDKRSIIENTEIGIIFESEQMANDIESWLDENLALVSYKLRFDPSNSTSEKIIWEVNDGKTVQRLDKEPDTGVFERIKMRAMSLLPIESQL